MANQFFMFESELSIIASEASKYHDRETGGDLYGLWTAGGNPVVYLAVGPGQRAMGQACEYEMDINYMRECERILHANYGIHYLGDWHSHHSLPLYQPSLGDQQRIQRLLQKNNINNMAEIIVTHSNSKTSIRERVDAYTYKNGFLTNSEVHILENKISPIRISIQSNLNQKLFNLGTRLISINQIQINSHVFTGGGYYKSSQNDTPPKVNGISINLKI